MFVSDEKTSELLKQATQYADAENWEHAIETCKKAKQSIIDSIAKYPTASLCRLGLFYSRAGRFDEAIAELNSLFELIPIIQKKFYCAETHWPAPIPEDLLEQSCFCHFKIVHESLRTVYKRAKLLDLAAKQDELIDECEKKHDKFNKKYDAWEKKVAIERRQANRALIKKALNPDS